ncbi:hypothetical protein FVE85_6057 [Porphyridium purpureum]|uniref:Uncharacterized protein n=1 Tax=Porphyridium purpureum TaxID=35688 RepID=A0A5J4Z5V5_PORPP|nr:hypothetical protein FVE85_6057 [Porphyridium purpureum]|eukprot:POR4360..scf295_1
MRRVADDPMEGDASYDIEFVVRHKWAAPQDGKVEAKAGRVGVQRVRGWKVKCDAPWCDLDDQDRVRIKQAGQYVVAIKCKLDKSGAHESTDPHAQPTTPVLPLTFRVEEEERVEFHAVRVDTTQKQGWMLHLAVGTALSLHSQLDEPLPRVRIDLSVALCLRKQKRKLTWDEELKLEKVANARAKKRKGLSGDQELKRRRIPKEAEKGHKALVAATETSSFSFGKDVQSNDGYHSDKDAPACASAAAEGDDGDDDDEDDEDDDEDDDDESWEGGFSSDSETKERDPQSTRNMRRLARAIRM